VKGLGQHRYVGYDDCINEFCEEYNAVIVFDDTDCLINRDIEADAKA